MDAVGTIIEFEANGVVECEAQMVGAMKVEMKVERQRHREELGRYRKVLSSYVKRLQKSTYFDIQHIGMDANEICATGHHGQHLHTLITCRWHVGICGWLWIGRNLNFAV